MKDYNLRIERENGKITVSTIEQEKKMKKMYLLKQELLLKFKARRREIDFEKNLSRVLLIIHRTTL